jgi:thioredoxin 1
MAAGQVTDKDFEEKVLKSSLPVLVDFWAPWCGPCKMAGPVIDELADSYSGKVSVVKVNVDENQESASKYGVMSIPTTIIFKDGKEQGRQIGFSGREAFEDLMKKVI